MWPAATSLYCS